MTDKPNVRKPKNHTSCHPDFIDVSQMLAYGLHLASKRSQSTDSLDELNEREEKRQLNQGLKKAPK